MNNAGKIVIVGAGPSGLAAALEATKNANDVLVFESSNHLGGLSKTIGFEDCLFDVGPHRFFTKNAEVNQLFNKILGNDQIRVKRLTRIFYKGKYFNYPITPLNALLGLGVFNSIAIIISYAFSRVKALTFPSQPNNFEDWVTSQFGSRLYRIFFKTYTEKVWGIPCTEISDQWASQRIKNLNLWESIVRSLFGSRRKVIKTIVDEFGYPRMGCGQFYHKMSSIVESSGGEVRLNSPVRRICHQDRMVKTIVVKNYNEEEQIVTGDYFLCSAPLTEILEMLDPAPPIGVLEASRALRYRDHIGVHLKMRDIKFPDNWIYIHSPEVNMARLSNYRNFSPSMADKDDISPITAEYFTFKDDAVWSLSNDQLIELAIREISTMELASFDQFVSGFVIRSEKAYPVIDQDSILYVETIRNWIKGFQNLIPIGRSGMFKYNNQDHAIATGLLAARTALGFGEFDPWHVNIDAEYLEEDRNS